jgi:hypothetical protein
MPMEETIAPLANPADLHKNVLWQPGSPTPRRCTAAHRANANAIRTSAVLVLRQRSFIGCSETRPNWLNGFSVKRSFFYADD